MTIENGILALKPHRNAVFPLLEEVCREYAPRAAAKGLSLTLAPCDAAAVFDPRWTKEAIGNILDNTVKYTVKGGISLSARDYELFTRIDIADTGIGIPEEEQARIFARFYRAEGSSDADGVGLGLYLVREIVTLGSGYIKVTSQVGERAVFSVYLPRPS